MSTPGKDKQRGPRGGVKHTPGRDHDSKSAMAKKKRYAAKQKKKLEAKALAMNDKRRVWDGLSIEKQRLLPELDPNQ